MKILHLDIETAPNTAYVWGLFDQNIQHDHLKDTSYILCWSAMWNHQSRIISNDTQGYLQGSAHYRNMLEHMWGLLDEADVVVHYYGSKFDIPVLNREFAKYKIGPPSPYKQVDLKLVVAKAFKFESNKLAHVASKLGLGDKIETDFSLWTGCMENDPEAWMHMIRYNRHDVRLLKQLYIRLLPWIEKHPSHSVFSERMACPKCGSIHVQKRGTQIASIAAYTRYHCQGCGAWFRNNLRVNKKGERGVNIQV